MRYNKNMEVHYFICSECHNAFPLPRFKYTKRKKKHVKDLYCPFCNKVVKTEEINDNEIVFDNER